METFSTSDDICSARRKRLSHSPRPFSCSILIEISLCVFGSSKLSRKHWISNIWLPDVESNLNIVVLLSLNWDDDVHSPSGGARHSNSTHIYAHLEVCIYRGIWVLILLWLVFGPADWNGMKTNTAPALDCVSELVRCSTSKIISLRICDLQVKQKISAFQYYPNKGESSWSSVSFPLDPGVVIRRVWALSGDDTNFRVNSGGWLAFDSIWWSDRSILIKDRGTDYPAVVSFKSLSIVS